MPKGYKFVKKEDVPEGNQYKTNENYKGWLCLLHKWYFILTD